MVLCWVVGYYIDEFVEVYVKDLVVCDSLGVGIFFVGVGCVFMCEVIEGVVWIC